jgi:hypothetical protein
MLWLIVALLVLCVYLTLPTSFHGLSRRYEELIAPLIFIAFAVMGLLTVFSVSVGGTIQAPLRRLEVWLERRLEDWQRRVAGISELSGD